MSDETTVHFPRKLVKQFIILYKDLECLWNRQCASYKAKLKRHEAITELTRLVQTYDPAATRVHVLRKIDSLRACVRREYKKVTESRQLAISESEVYVPQLWYYDLFSFLMRQEEGDSKRGQPVTVEASHSPEPTAETSEEEEEESEDPPSDDIKPEPTYEADFVTEYNPRQSSPSNSPPRRPTHYEEPRRKRSRPRAEPSAGVDDEYDAIGINVAAKLRHLPENMRILAEKLISDVLFQAQTNGLTSATVLITPDPFK